jgi:hypothetical protein
MRVRQSADGARNDWATRLPRPRCSPCRSRWRVDMSGSHAFEYPAGRALKSLIDQTRPWPGKFASVDQKALDRIAHLVDMLRDLDRMVHLTSRCGATGAYSEAGRLPDIAAIESDGEISIVRSAEFDASERPWLRASESQKHDPEEKVLDNIAKGVGNEHVMGQVIRLRKDPRQADCHSLLNPGG